MKSLVRLILSSQCLSLVLLGVLGFSAALHASVRMSSGTNPFSGRTTFATSASYALPEGDWTIGIWDNNFQGDGGVLISGAVNLAYVPLGRAFAHQGNYMVWGVDSVGNLFGSGGKIMQNAIAGTLPEGYPGRITGKFTPRLHIIRRRAGYSEYLVAEAGHAPVLVCSEQRAFGATSGSWGLANINGYAELYDSDLEGFFLATTAIADKDIALMAAGHKPTSVTSLAGNLALYFPLETAVLSNTANPVALPNQGSATSIALNRKGPVTNFADGPMLRGATTETNTPDQVTELTQVVTLNSFQPFQVIRHLNGSANVRFTGFDYGTGTADIEIRFIDVEHGTSTPWQTLALGSLGGGAAVDATIPVAKGYWKTIEVRRVNSAGGTGNSSRPNRTWSRWAVGEVVAIWGDSIQGHLQSSSRFNLVVPNGYTAKYPTSSTSTLPGDTNPLSYGMWNLLQGGGEGGASQGEAELVNNLSAASQCCVGFMVYWAGATQLSNWKEGAAGSPTRYDLAKAYCMANGGLNKPNLFTWVGNLASAKANDNFYANLDDFRVLLDKDFTAGAWRLLLAPVPIIYSNEVTPGKLHTLRDACRRWVEDNPETAAFAGVFLDHGTYDGVHPDDAAYYRIGPRWGNAAAYLRDQQNYVDPRGGEITNFYRSGANLIVQVQLFGGTALSLKDPAAAISGFTLSADNFATTIPITSAVLINGTTVRLTPSSLPAGPLKLRYAYGRPGESGATLAALGMDNLLYVNAGPTNLIAVQPIWGTAANNWSLAEGTATPPAIAADALPAGELGSAYNHALSASGGSSPYSWTVDSGNLAPGLTLDNNGVIQGTPTAAGTSQFTVRVTGDNGVSSTASLSLTVTSRFASWQSARFTPTEISSGLADADEDFDHDGVPNLLEYALGGDPKIPDATLIVPAAQVDETTLRFSFVCDEERRDIVYVVQASGTLAASSWIDIATSVGGATVVPVGTLCSVTDPGTGRRSVTVSDTTPLTAGNRRFLRVKVTAL